MTQNTDSLLLHNEKTPYEECDVNPLGIGIPEYSKYTHAKISGIDSFYVVYNEVNMNSVESEENEYMIVDSKYSQALNFPPKSAQGWNKIGITLFKKTYYGGIGVTFFKTTNDVTQEFQPDVGIGSFIVKKGVWSLYTAKNCEAGKEVSIDGKTKFKPDDTIPINDHRQILSIKKIDE